MTTMDMHRTRDGTRNPEQVDNALWKQAVRGDWSAPTLRRHLGIDLEAEHFRFDFAHSTYRNAAPGPFWSWKRLGRTSTIMADGRIIHVGGEHGDAYDVNFCIYNDVVVEGPGQRLAMFLYPRAIFAPTDFHTATLVGDTIILIGGLGYKDLRQVSVTQVHKLDTGTMRTEPIETTGKGPGWISRHTAEQVSASTILVRDGSVQTQKAYEKNMQVYLLDLANNRWSVSDAFA